MKLPDILNPLYLRPVDVLKKKSIYPYQNKDLELLKTYDKAAAIEVKLGNTKLALEHCEQAIYYLKCTRIKIEDQLKSDLLYRYAKLLVIEKQIENGFNALKNYLEFQASLNDYLKYFIAKEHCKFIIKLGISNIPDFDFQNYCLQVKTWFVELFPKFCNKESVELFSSNEQDSEQPSNPKRKTSNRKKNKLDKWTLYFILDCYPKLIVLNQGAGQTHRIPNYLLRHKELLKTYFSDNTNLERDLICGFYNFYLHTRNYSKVYETLIDLKNSIDQHCPDDLNWQVNYQLKLGYYYSKIGEFHSSNSSYTNALERLDRMSKDVMRFRINLYWHQALLEWEWEHLDIAYGYFEKIFRLYKEHSIRPNEWQDGILEDWAVLSALLGKEKLAKEYLFNCILDAFELFPNYKLISSCFMILAKLEQKSGSEDLFNRYRLKQYEFQPIDESCIGLLLIKNYLNRVECLLNLKAFELAESYLENCLKQFQLGEFEDPKTEAIVYFYFAKLHFLTHREEEYLKFSEQALQKDPNIQLAWYELALCYNKRNLEIEKERQIFAWYKLLETTRNKEKFNLALLNLEALDPDNAFVHKIQKG